MTLQLRVKLLVVVELADASGLSVVAAGDAASVSNS